MGGDRYSSRPSTRAVSGSANQVAGKATPMKATPRRQTINWDVALSWVLLLAALAAFWVGVVSYVLDHSFDSVGGIMAALSVGGCQQHALPKGAQPTSKTEPRG